LEEAKEYVFRNLNQVNRSRNCLCSEVSEVAKIGVPAKTHSIVQYFNKKIFCFAMTLIICTLI
jgi:hypothetical protein